LLACSIVEELQLLYDLKKGFQKDEIQILWDIYDQTKIAISIINIFYFIITIDIL